MRDFFLRKSFLIDFRINNLHVCRRRKQDLLRGCKGWRRWEVLEKVKILYILFWTGLYPGRLVERNGEERGAMRERAFACERAFWEILASYTCLLTPVCKFACACLYIYIRIYRQTKSLSLSLGGFLHERQLHAATCNRVYSPGGVVTWHVPTSYPS